MNFQLARVEELNRPLMVVGLNALEFGNYLRSTATVSCAPPDAGRNAEAYLENALSPWVDPSAEVLFIEAHDYTRDFFERRQFMHVCNARHFMLFRPEHSSEALMFLRMNRLDPNARRIYRGYQLYQSTLKALNVGALYDDLVQWGSYLQLVRDVVMARRMPWKRSYLTLLAPRVMLVQLLTEPTMEKIMYALKCVRDSFSMELHRDRFICDELDNLL